MSNEENNEEINEEYEEVNEEKELNEQEKEKIQTLRLVMLDMTDKKSLETALEIVAQKQRYELLSNFEEMTQRTFIRKISDYSLQYVNKHILEKFFSSLDNIQYKIFETLTNNANGIEIYKNGYITYEIHFFKKYENNTLDIAEIKINYSELSDKANAQILIGNIDFDGDITQFYAKVIEHIIKVLNDP